MLGLVRQRRLIGCKLPRALLPQCNFVSVDYIPAKRELTEKEVTSYHRDGFIFVRGMYAKDEAFY